MKTKLANICSINYGKDHKHLAHGSVPVYGSGGLMRYANESLYNKPSVLIPRKGTLQNLFFVDEPFWTVDTLFWTDIDTKQVMPRFLYYSLKIKKLINLNVGTAVPSLTTTVLNDVEIYLPSLREQQRIVNILAPVDDKIELNRKMNENLELQAAALFKHWFVDFEFPDAKGNPYRTSGGKMKESSLGMIPESWRVVKLGDITAIQNGFAFKSQDYVSEGCNLIQTRNISNNFVNMQNIIKMPASFYSNNKFDKFQLNRFDTLLVMVGASVGKIGLITDLNLPALQNQNMWRFRPLQEKFSSVYVYYLIKYVNNRMRNQTNGSARDFYTKKIFNNAICLFPSDEVLSLFFSLGNSFFEKININILQNAILAEKRDALMHSLLSDND